ncbi:MAG: hypothetical protein AAF797_04075 [Planctomycetota bacterium]
MSRTLGLIAVLAGVMGVMLVGAQPVVAEGDGVGKPLIDVAFDDPAGTPLAEVELKTSAETPAEFNDSPLNSATDGRGGFVVRRPADGPQNSYINLEGFNIEAAPVYVTTVIRAYHLAGTSTFERLNVGLADSNHPSRPRAVAQFVFDRNDDGDVELNLQAFGALAENPEQKVVLPGRLDQPLTVVMKYDAARQVMEGSCRVGDGPWVWLGEGRTDRNRTAWYLRFRATGNWSSTDAERLVVDRILVSRDDPRRAGLQ